SPGVTSLVETILGGYSQDKGKKSAFRKKAVSLIENALAQAPSPENHQLAFSLIQWRYRDEEETEEMLRRQLADYQRFVVSYPESRLVTEALQRQADIYRQKLKDWAEAAEVYTRLIEEKNQKHLIPSLATCLVQLGNREKAISLLRTYLKEKPADYSSQLQLAETLLEAGHIAEGIASLRELLNSSAGQYLKEKASKTMKTYRQVIPDNFQWPAELTQALFICQKTQNYFFTNAPSLKPGDPLLAQRREKISVFPWTKERKNLSLTLSVTSDVSFLLTEPLSFIDKKEKTWTTSWEIQPLGCPEVWRKEEAWTLLFPWREITEKNCLVERLYQQQPDNTVSLTITVLLPEPGPWQLEIQTSRWQKLETIEPEPQEKLGSFIIYRGLSPETRPFTVVMKGKVPSSIQYVYPKLTLTRLVESAETRAEFLNRWNYQLSSGLQYTLALPEQEKIQLTHLVKQEETIYELDEKVEWQ
ncbi:MAG: tetratricopeptide repeat protein, partial [Candidatus Omnitrophica bacterium]|nr:tetratricopeptide repeat protein [Candidatus Omnitrophota bacterium]